MQTSLLVTALLMGLPDAGAGRAAHGNAVRATGTFQLGRVIGYGALGGLAAATMQGLG